MPNSDPAPDPREHPPPRKATDARPVDWVATAAALLMPGPLLGAGAIATGSTELATLVFWVCRVVLGLCALIGARSALRETR